MSDNRKALININKSVTQQPYGRGCFTFENACMQHGHYVHAKDPDYDETKEEPAEVRIHFSRYLSFLRKDNKYSIQQGRVTEPATLEAEAGEGNKKLEDTEGAKLEEAKPVPFEPLALKKGVIALWRARCITPYNADLLPPEPVPLQEEVRYA